MPSIILSDNGVSSGSAGIKTSGSNDGTLALQTTTSGGTATTAVSIDTSQNVTLPNSLSTANTFGFKNRIINGGMTISQRGTSFTNAASGDYTLDRLQYRATASTWQFTIAQSQSSPPAGFSHFALWTSTNASSVGSTDRIAIGQTIEANNIADLAWGTANAKPVTLSFWVKCSVTGTLGGAIQNSAANYCYPFSYTVSAANTWEYKTVAITGPTAGTWATGTGIGAYVYFSLGTGTSLESTAGTWVAAERWSATSTVDLVTTSGNTFALTGFQFEAGSQATSFDFRSYGTELALCQRYCVVYSGGAGYRLGLGFAYSTTGGIAGCNLPVTMRVAPSISGTASNVSFNDSIAAYNCGAPTLNSSQENFVSFTATTSGMTTGRGNQMYFTNSGSLILSSEL